MIISRAPLRVSFAGGGLDFPAYYAATEEPLYVIGSAINLFSYCALVTPRIIGRTGSKIRLSYSSTENVDDLDQLKHDLARETLRLYQIDRPLHISSFSDVPVGSGLGSSSSFLVALITTLDYLTEVKRSQKELACFAYEIERNICRNDGGIQDHLWAAYGSTGAFLLTKNNIEFVPMSDHQKALLNNQLSLVSMDAVGRESTYQTGFFRVQVEKSERNGSAIRSEMHRYSTIAFNQMKKSLNSIDFLAEVMRKTWGLKKQVSKVDNDVRVLISEFEAAGLAAKLCGAGGNGFVATLGDFSSLNIESAKVLHPGLASVGSHVIFNDGLA